MSESSHEGQHIMQNCHYTVIGADSAGNGLVD